MSHRDKAVDILLHYLVQAGIDETDDTRTEIAECVDAIAEYAARIVKVRQEGRIRPADTKGLRR